MRIAQKVPVGELSCSDKVRWESVSMNTILFIENKEDVEVIEELKRNEEFLIISLDPEVTYTLEKKGLIFKVQDDYFSFDEYLKLGLESFDKVEKFCKYCDFFLQENIGFLKENKLNLASYHYYCFKILFDVLVSKIFVLKKIIEKENPRRIYFFDNNISESIDEGLYFKEKSPYNEVLKILCKYYNINCKEFTTRKEKDISQIAEPPINKTINFIFDIYRMFRKTYDILSGKYKELPVIFMTFPGYDLSYVAKLIKKENMAKILCFDPESGKKPQFIFLSWEKVKALNYDKTISENINLLKIWQNLSKDKEFRGFFMLDNIDTFPIAEQKMKYFFTVFVKALINLYISSFELFKTYKPKVFFAPFIVRARMLVVAEAARKNNIPLAVYQHGGVYGYSNCKINRETDFQYCDYYISFGEGVKRRLQNSRANIISVGSFLLNDLRKMNTMKNGMKIKKKLGINKKRKIVVYVMNPIYRNWNYIDYTYYTDHECFNVQRKIIDIFAKHSKYQYILKVFPIYNEKDPIVPYVNDKKNKNFEIVYDVSFREILPCADLIVMDAVSTPLLEALTTSQKIMIYDLFKGTFSDAIEILKKRAYYSRDIDEYLKELDRALEEGDFFIENPDNEFSEIYGKHDDLKEMNSKIENFLNEKINDEKKEAAI